MFNDFTVVFKFCFKKFQKVVAIFIGDVYVFLFYVLCKTVLFSFTVINKTRKKKLCGDVPHMIKQNYSLKILRKF